MTVFRHLFEPIQVGGVTIRNRIMSTGHDTMLPTDGFVNDPLVAYHEARAAGGVGLIVLQVSGVHETARYTTHMLMATEDRSIEGYRRVAEAVHRHGGTVFGQIFHPGREILEAPEGLSPIAWAPSSVPSERFRVMPRALTLPLIREIVTGFGDAARRMQEAGLDGVEIVASHGYLPSQFLNPRVNRRTDAYGGPWENRLRFLREVIAAIRARMKPGFVTGLRISVDERDEEGLGEQDALAAIEAVAGELDYVNVTAGTSASAGGAVHIVPPMSVRSGYLAPFSAKVRERVSIPVFVTGRINQPQDAEAILAAGHADLCGMTRALISDPLMPAKAREGRLDDIRACIGCNQACIGHFQKGVPISCIQNPVTGRELTFGAAGPASARRRIMVVGGGPAGMKAAVVAAQRGHDVTLYEASGRLGGQALLAQLLPGRAEFGGLVTNLARELELAGVTVRRGVRVDAGLVEREAPDAVILATGGRPYAPDFVRDGDLEVATSWEVLAGAAEPGSSVVIADSRGDWIGIGLAEDLARKGRSVRLAVPGPHAGEAVQSYIRDLANATLRGLGVEVLPYARLYGTDTGTVYLQHTVTQEAIVCEGVDTLVLCQGNVPDTALADALAGYEGEVHAIGDCLVPRNAEDAVYEATRLALSL